MRRSITRSRVLDLCYDEIGGSDLRQFVHGNSDVFPQHHRLYSHPTILFQRVDGRGATSGSDLARDIKFRSVDVVCAQNVLLCSYEKLVLLMNAEVNATY